ncbi:mesoderm induction early response protein 1 [Brevipalpus obovatus]|uniref:mesoderm induction early response protein 1 n=1 Tax=Brevipalpus obovatus TaxID=246614 RepID=UPI003D9EAE3D
MASPSAMNDSDQDFDPTPEMLVNDFDEERTLDEEEANEDETNISNEISDLEKEGEMPLEQLLALYGYEQSSCTTAGNSGTSTANQLSSNNTTSATLAKVISDESFDSNCESLETDAANTSQENHCNQSSSGSFSTNTNLMISLDQGFEFEEEEDDDDGSESDWRRTIQVGADYQATIPNALSKYGDLPPYENEDKILWEPNILPEDKIVVFLSEFSQYDTSEGEASSLKNDKDNGQTSGKVDETSKGSKSSMPASGNCPRSTTHPSNPRSSVSLNNDSIQRDDENALYTLHHCGYNIEEALRRKKMHQCSTLYEPMTPWSNDECTCFEEGLKIFGKDFHQIQKNKISTRSVAELVQFYYFWKKTERYDAFASKQRIDKKKYSLHPGVTDYMDRYLDEQELFALQTYSSTTNNSNSSAHPHNPHDNDEDENAISAYLDSPYQQNMHNMWRTWKFLTDSRCRMANPNTPLHRIPLPVINNCRARMNSGKFANNLTGGDDHVSSHMSSDQINAKDRVDHNSILAHGLLQTGTSNNDPSETTTSSNYHLTSNLNTIGTCDGRSVSFSSGDNPNL